MCARAIPFGQVVAYQNRGTVSAVSISQEQRKKLGLPHNEAAQSDQERAPDLERIEEGQEISADAAERLQPQMGNAAVQALLDRTSSTTQSSSGTAELELAEDVGRGEEEEFEGGNLDMPTMEMGGGGGDGSPVEIAPWEVGRLFGGDDDDPKPTKPKRIPKPRRRTPAQTSGETANSESDLLDPKHIEHIETHLGKTPLMKEEFRSGDARYRAVEPALAKPHTIGARSLNPESMVDRTDHLDPIGRPTSIARFLVRSANHGNARALSRCLAGPASAWLPNATGHAGAAARLASMTVCTEACEGGGTPTDNAIRLAMCHDAWPSAIAAASTLAQTGRVVAPEIVEKAGEVLHDAPVGHAKTHTTTEALTGIELGRKALVSILPESPLPPVPSVHFAHSPPSPIADPAIAAVDALLQEYTGGLSPTDLPVERRLESHQVQPVLDAATALVNRMGQTQVELAAAAIAISRVRPKSPVRGTLIHADRAMRELARSVVRHGDRLHRAIGAPEAATNQLPGRAVTGIREAAAAFEGLRTWSLNAIAEALYR